MFSSGPRVDSPSNLQKDVQIQSGLTHFFGARLKVEVTPEQSANLSAMLVFILIKNWAFQLLQHIDHLLTASLRDSRDGITCSETPVSHANLKERCTPMADNLKLMALDADDLLVISAHVQDSVLLSAEIEFDPKKGLLFLPINRFAWEAPSARRLLFKKYERRRSILHFSKITALKSSGVDRGNATEVQSLLSIAFTASEDAEDPGGQIQLNFGGGGGLLLEVECIEAQLTDLGAAWKASSKPQHDV